MRISEIFYSVQGEGELTGIPSVFVRTSGCNLRCGWCDTPYASWAPEGPEMTIEAILAEVQKHPTRYVVLTGGEPMVAKAMRDLCRELRSLGKHITIETAATIAPEAIDCDLASLSPKLSNSNPKSSRTGSGPTTTNSNSLSPRIPSSGKSRISSPKSGQAFPQNGSN